MKPNTAASLDVNEWSIKNDQQLLAHVARGDKSAMTEFISRYHRRILDFVRRQLGPSPDVEDIAQEAFIRVWCKAPQWQNQSGQNHLDPNADKAARAWLYRITYNLCIDSLRRRKPDANGDSQEPQACGDDALPEQILHQQQRQHRLNTALENLSAGQRTAIVLCNYQDLSNREAASVMDISVDALESLLARGRNNLRAQLIDT